MLSILHAASPADLRETRTLFEEYAAALEHDLSFQGFQEELATLPGKYARPDGRLLLASWDDALAGCVALRPLESGTCELKRLYVRPGSAGAIIPIPSHPGGRTCVVPGFLPF